MKWIILAPVLWALYTGLLFAKPLFDPYIFAVIQLFCTAVLLRHLHEITHMAIHHFRPDSWGAMISDILYHLPCGADTFLSRVASHCGLHHKYAADPNNDPSIYRLRQGGLNPGSSKWQFFSTILFPLRPAGWRVRLGNLVFVRRNDESGFFHCARILCVALVPFGIFWINQSVIDVLIYLLGIIVLAPFFHWISLLCEHPWYSAGTTRRSDALHYIDFSGISGLLLKYTIFCYTDNLHSLHHHKPRMSHRQLKKWAKSVAAQEIISQLKNYDSVLLSSQHKPSALADLMERVCENKPT